MKFSASHFKAEDLFAATHTHQLIPRAETILNVDLRQRGLGRGSCGSDTLDAYEVAPANSNGFTGSRAVIGLRRIARAGERLAPDQPPRFLLHFPGRRRSGL